MKIIENELRKEMNQLENIIKDARKRLKMAPKGQLKIMSKCGKAQYYYKKEKAFDSKIKYIKKSELELAKSIAQRDYDVRLVKKAEERIKAIGTFMKKYEVTSLKKLYEDLNPYRKDIIYAPVISDEEYIKQWQSIKYNGKSFDDDYQEIITDRGERVRSKSEKIIADKLNFLGIPYRYECPLILKGNIKVYPDFTILKMPEREEVYLEHFGMMDDSNYMSNVIYKLNTYEKNKIYIGVNLYVTYETSKNPINVRALDDLIRHLFYME